jgi:starvation-inducible outer membrane lipoprotein
VKSFVGVLLVLWCTALSACAAHPVFPPKVLEGVDSNFDFARWRMMPNEAEGKKVQLGGQIVQSQTSGDTVTIVVSQMPIVEHPAYGPKDNGKNNGEFVITYQGQIKALNLQPGNRVIVIGTTRPSKVVTAGDFSRSFPIVAAQCLHVWNTQGRDIDEFPFFEAGYETLEQKTICARTSTP